MKMSATMSTQGLLKIKLFLNKGYAVIIYVHDITNKVLSCDSHYLVDVVMSPKFGNSSFSIREVIIVSILSGFDQKNCFFEGWSWFKFNNLGLALGKNFKFYISVAEKLKLKVRECWKFVPTFLEVTDEKLTGGFLVPPS